MSILPICSMACMTRLDFCASLSASISPSILGMICHETPNLSFNQPHRLSAPPADSRSHSSSTSACVSQETNSEIASVNLNIGPPLNAMNCWPSSSKVQEKTEPSVPDRPASPLRETLTTREFLKIEM